ncbi:MAG TPA: sodium/glutamate symporter, partial [Leptospiraceae bacterium]|nr:sodium/glutamate symporter [Leptospiraceae bacterium]
MIHFFITIVILGIASVVTQKIDILKRYRIPVSLTSSLIVLAFFTGFPSLKELPIYATWKTWPSIFIALIFAALFLERSEGKQVTSEIRESLGETYLVWITIVGQMVVGLFLSLILFKPFFNLPLAFTSVLETGFAGGHGTAVAMNQSYIDNGLPNGQEYGLFSATVGLILGIVGGIILIRRERGAGIVKEEEGDKLNLDPLKVIITLTLIFGAFLIGSLLKENILHLLDYIQADSFLSILKRLIPSLPLFVYALIGGVLVKAFLKLIQQENLIENSIINLASNVFMELLIFSGIASIDMKVISDAIVPLAILFSIGFIWNVFCHYYVRPKLIKDEYSFELSLINFGMVNGTTGIGLMLMKMVDPECKTKAL